MPDEPNRRDQILEKAAELFAGKGVAATTIRDIAKEVGVISGSLYHYFPSKDAIVDAIISDNLSRLKSGYARAVAENADPRDRLRALVRESLEIARSYPHASEIYQNEHTALVETEGFEYLRSAARDIEKPWLDAIEAGVAQGVLRDDVPPPVFYRLLRDAVWLSVRWFKADQNYDIDQLVDDCTSIFLDGFNARDGAA